MEHENKKRCSKCRKWLAFSEFHAYTSKTARSPDGLRAQCKSCRCADQRERYNRNKAK